MKSLRFSDTVLELDTVVEGVSDARCSGKRIPGRFHRILEAERERRGEGESGSRAQCSAAGEKQVQPGLPCRGEKVGVRHLP